MDGNNQLLQTTQQLNQALAETKQRMSQLGNQSILVQDNVSRALGRVRSQVRQLGNTMVPVANIGLNLFHKLLSLLQPVARGLASFLTTLFGVKWAGQTRSINGTTAALSRHTRAVRQSTSALKSRNKSLGKTAKATRSVALAQRDLMSFDEINKLSAKTSTGTSGSGGAGGKLRGGSGSCSALEGMQVAVSGLALKLRKILQDIWSPFQKAWKRKGAYVTESARTAMEKIGRAAKSFGRTWLKVWRDQAGVKIVNTVLNILARVCQTAGNLADRFREAWENCGTGKRIVETVFGIIQDGLTYVENLAAATKNWSEKLNLKPLLQGISTILEAFRNFAGLLEGAFADAYKHVLLPLARWTIQSGVPAVLNGMAGGFRLLSGVLSLLQPAAAAVWEHFLKPIASWTGGFAVKALQGLGIVMGKLGGILQKIGAVLSSTDSWTEKLKAIGGILVNGLKNGISSAFAGIESWMKTNVIGRVVQAMSGLGGGVKVLFASAFSTALGAWKSLGSKFQGLAASAVRGLRNGLGGGVKRLFAAAYSTACGAWKNIGSYFKKMSGKVISGIQSGLSFKKLRKAMLAPFRGAFNGVIAMVNQVVSKINSALRFSWGAVRVAGVTLVRAGSVTLAHLPRLSYLAQGGVVSKATPALVGEAGAEAVVPLEQNLGWLDKMAGMLAQRLEGTAGNDRPIVVRCVLDGKVIATNTVNYINKRARATGVNPLAACL